jgi:hypothetical protein
MMFEIVWLDGNEGVVQLSSSRCILHVAPQVLLCWLTPHSGSVAERFADTFTKMRAFQMDDLGYTKCVFLDADMAVFRNADQLFETQVPAKDHIAANHACVWNLDHNH